MDTKRFLLTWMTICFVMAAGIAAFNVAMDPYLIFGTPIAGFNKAKPASGSHEEISKTYLLARVNPRAVILGNSRSDIALDPDDTAWPEQLRPVYNASLVAASPALMKKMLEHVLATKSPELILIGLDFEYFLFDPDKVKQAGGAIEGNEEQSRLDSLVGSASMIQTVQDGLMASLTLGAFEDSISTAAANLTGRTGGLSPLGHMTEDGFRELIGKTGQYSLFAEQERKLFDQLGPTRLAFSLGEYENPGMRDLRGMLDLAIARGIRVMLFLHPNHADRFEQLRLLGYLKEFEDWKRALVELVAHYQSDKGGLVAPIWDFDVYGFYSNESIPKPDDLTTRLNWFWEPAHYTMRLGHLVLEQMFNAHETSDFGVRLTPETLEADLASFREAREQFRNSNPQDVERLEVLFRRQQRLWDQHSNRR